MLKKDITTTSIVEALATPDFPKVCFIRMLENVDIANQFSKAVEKAYPVANNHTELVNDLRRQMLSKFVNRMTNSWLKSVERAVKGATRDVDFRPEMKPKSSAKRKLDEISG
jgi:hypothetical protein